MLYITKEDKLRLEKQYEECIGKQKILSDRIGRARELGDLKENAEYHAAKEDQGFNEAKIRELKEKLSIAVVADTEHLPDDIVFVGATVKLRDVDSKAEDLYKLVGDATGNFDVDYIEVTPNSPMGEALMKSKVGDVIRVNLRRGKKRFEIIEIVS
ncbi:MAG: transcription elongation factor GreA [Planctomycetota bacterium]|nr:transcription elongation factor GreA [Planctomycetota bacterium]